jgi:hypothetical protein
MDASPAMMTRTQNRISGHDDYTRDMLVAQPICRNILAGLAARDTARFADPTLVIIKGL